MLETCGMDQVRVVLDSGPAFQSVKGDLTNSMYMEYAIFPEQ